MKSVVITLKNETEYKFLSGLLNKLGIKQHTLTEEEVEDAGLLMMMKQVDRSKKVSRESIMKKLQS